MVSSVEIFDPRLESWMPGEPMNYTRGYSAAAVVNDAIYVIGGVQESATIAETVSYTIHPYLMYIWTTLLCETLTVALT